MSKKPYYITTAIAYTSGKPHIGNSYEIVLADAIARTGETETGANVTVYSDAFLRSQATVRGDAFALSVKNCGAGEENRTVYALEAAERQAFARIANFGEDCSVSMICEADGVLCDAREIEISAGETAGVSFVIPEAAQHVRVSLREKDALAADNTAEASVRHVTTKTVAVTSDSVFLESALRVRPDMTVERTEEKALVKQGIEAIQTVLLGKDSSAKRRLLFYLDQYLDPFYQNDLSDLNEPLKALLQEVMNSDNEVDVIEEAHHLLEAYMEIE